MRWSGEEKNEMVKRRNGLIGKKEKREEIELY